MAAWLPGNGAVRKFNQAIRQIKFISEILINAGIYDNL